MENREESEYYKCIFYWKYNERLIIILRRLMINYNELWQKLREYPYRHMDVKILDKVDAKYGKGKKILRKMIRGWTRLQGHIILGSELIFHKKISVKMYN